MRDIFRIAVIIFLYVVIATILNTYCPDYGLTPEEIEEYLPWNIGLLVIFAIFDKLNYIKDKLENKED